MTNDRWGFGVAIADYDNDGWPDIYVSNFGKNRLYHNNHDGTFTDVAEKAGVQLGQLVHAAPRGATTTATAGSICSSPATFTGTGTTCPTARRTAATTLSAPSAAKPWPADRAASRASPIISSTTTATALLPTSAMKAGVDDKPGYYGLGAVFVDINNDGKVDLLVGNDSTPNYMYLNKGDGTFEDVSYASGFALNEAGRETASMGIAVGDYQNNGQLAVFDTTFSDDYKPFYRNEGDGNLTDISYHIGHREISVPFLSWGDAFLDYDNDGWKDLLMSDGHVYPEADKYNWGTSWKQRPMLFHNLQGKKFEVVPAVEGTGLADVIAGRGMAVGDLFNDGKIDAVINVMDGHPVLLRNVTPDHNHWLELKLVGGPKSPRDAVGSTMYVTANGMKQRGDVISGGSYLSSNDPRPHFGLGQATKIDDIEIHWPERQGRARHRARRRPHRHPHRRHRQIAAI